MKKTYLFILLFCALSFTSNAQAISTIEKNLLDSVSLRISLKTCVLMETDTFILFTPSKYLMEPFALWVKAHPELVDDKILYKAIEGDTGRRMCRADKIADEHNLSERMLPQIAGCLKIGRCLIYNKLTQQLEKKITIQDYLIYNHAEVRYLVNNTFLFMVYD